MEEKNYKSYVLMKIPLLQFHLSFSPNTHYSTYMAFLIFLSTGQDLSLFYSSALDAPPSNHFSHPFLLASSHSLFGISCLCPLPTVSHSSRACCCFLNARRHHSYFFLSAHILPLRSVLSSSHTKVGLL